MSKRRVFMVQSLAIFGLVGLSVVSCSQKSDRNTLINSNNQEVKTMKLTSSAFDADGLIPVKYTCDGEDISPPLIWDELPVGT